MRFYPAPGGVPVQAYLLAKELVRRGHEVVVVTTDSFDNSDVPGLFHRSQAHKLRRYENINGIKVYRYPTLHRFYGLILTQPMLKLLEPADVILAHGLFHLNTSLQGALVAKLKEEHLILNVHDATISPFNTVYAHAYMALYRRTLGRLLLYLANKVIVPTPTIVGSLNGLVYPGKVEVIPNGIDLDMFNGGDPNSFKEKFFPSADFMVLYVGRLAKEKGIQYLIQAAPFILRRFPNTSFVVAGTDDGYMSTLRKLAFELHVAHSFVFTGPLSQEDLVSAYKAADVFALPSELEAFGIVLVEAMACGIPIVASNYGGIRHVARNGVTGLLFRLGDAKQLAEKIILLLSDKNIRLKLGERGRMVARQLYSIKRVTDQYELLFQNVVK